MPLSDPFVTVDEVVANASTILPENKVSPRLRNLMRQWVYLGEKQLGFSGVHEKAIGDLPVTNLTISKPSDYALGIDMALFDSSGNEYLWHYRGNSERIHLAGSFIYNPSGLQTSYNSSKNKVGVAETPYAFKLDSYGENIATANLRYYSYPIDDNQEMLIPEHHMFALMMFISFMFWTKEGEKGSMDRFSDLWDRHKKIAKTANKMPSELEGRDLARHHNSLIDKIFYERY